jgi:cytoskeleton protein RodZ
MGYPQDETGAGRGGRDFRHGYLVFGDPCVRDASAGPVGASVGSGVMALDTGNVPDEFRAHPDWKDPVPPITEAPTLGAGLRAARLASGRSMAELSTATRVHVRYLTALEENDWSVLPTRVFAIGYVRAYAHALGLDEQLAVERFKRDVPDGSVPLQPPVGVAFEEVRRHSPRVIAAVAVVVVAVLGWNVFQRLNLLDAPSRSDLVAVPETWSLGGVLGQDNPATLEAPRPAPAEQTVPVLYVTPGLEEQLTGAAPVEGAPEASTGPVARAFNPRGAVHGAAAGSSDVIIQARRPAYVVVRMPDQRVLFARQMAAGEAWRAPRGVTAVIDVADPAAFDVYMFGEHAGTLPTAQTQVGTLNGQAQARARQTAAAAEAAARDRAAREAAAAPPSATAPAPTTTAARPAAPAAGGPGVAYDSLTR